MKTFSKILITLCLLIWVALPVTYGQKKDQIVSKGVGFIPTKKEKTSLPPNLFAELDYNDDNGNGILEGPENSVLSLKIINKGKGNATNLFVTVKSNITDEHLIIKDGIKIPIIKPGANKTIKIPINAELGIKSGKHKMEINVSEQKHYDMDPAYLILTTREYQKPKIVLSGLEIYDSGDDVVAIKEDGKLQAGEWVKMKILIQNVGNNIAQNVDASITSTDVNIKVKNLNNKEFLFDQIKVGEVKELWCNISPNKRVITKDDLPVYIDVGTKYNYGSLKTKLPLKLEAKPPETEILEVHANLDDLQNKASFEFSSNSFSTKKSKIINIRMVEPIDTIIPNSVGVIIGIENYQNLPEAPYAVQDAKLMKEYFKKRFGIEEVVIFTEKEASGFFFDDIFNPDYGELRKAVEEGSTDLFVFYSGHGIPSKDGKNVYLFPQDGKVARLKTQGYELSKFYNNLDKLKAKSVTVFLDACFSGATRSSDQYIAQNLTGEKGIIIKPKMPKPWESNPNFTVFTSSTGGQTSLAYDESKTGLFSYFLMAGLMGKADVDKDSVLTMMELKSYVIENVTKTSKKISGIQVPEFHGNADKIIFDKRKKIIVVEEENEEIENEEKEE